MIIEDINEFSELFKGYFPYYLLVALPIFIVMSPVNPVGAAHEFPVYRMQQFDLHSVPHGCRSTSVNLEAKSLMSWSTSRHCVVARFQDITSNQLREIRVKAGALFVVLPNDLSSFNQETLMQMMEIEEEMLSQETLIPVYFASWNTELQSVLEDVSSSFITNDKTSSGLAAFLDAISANGYQIAISPTQAMVKTGVQISNIQGKLSGLGMEDNLPTIAVVAHYDSFGVAPELSFGSDSNGSGVVLLLELARIFSVLYSNPKTHAPYNFIFLLSGGGKFNYLGSKKWLEDQIDGVESSLVQDAAFVLCLDSLSSNTTLHLHVSKPPKETSSRGIFFNQLQNIAGNSNVEMIHKKINLAEDFLAWEHERYGIRRLPAITVSALRSHKDLKRTTIFDRRENIDVATLTENAKTIAQALARLVYNNTKIDVFSDHFGIEMDSIKALLDLVSNQPRSAQLLSERNSPFVYSLKEILAKYCRDVKITTLSPDKRDPDFVFYDVTQSTVNIYSVKPAIFDLFLTMGILAYLGLVYLFLVNFPYIYANIVRVDTQRKKD